MDHTLRYGIIIALERDNVKLVKLDPGTQIPTYPNTLTPSNMTNQFEFNIQLLFDTSCWSFSDNKK